MDEYLRVRGWSVGLDSEDVCPDCAAAARRLDQLALDFGDVTA